jgi:glycosyltransferase involved in cell wall biosynthesis
VSGIGFVFLKRNLLFNIVKPLYKYASSKTLEVWFLNKEDQVFFHDEGIVRDDKVKVLPGEGIHVEHFTRSKPYSDLPDSPFTFLFSARLLWEKGIGYYVHAAKKLKLEFEQVKFLVIGFYDVGNKHAVQPEDMAIWEKAAIIQYLGAVKDVRATLEQTNCLVFPSYYKEGVPRVLLEAASMEIPIITTDNVGCREIIRDNENGLICKTKDEDSLYEKMKAMILMSKEIRTKMGSEGRKLILKNYDEKLVISYYAHVFNDYIEKD